MKRLNDKVKIAVIWILFIAAFIISGVLLYGRLMNIVRDYIISQVSSQAEYAGVTVSDKLYREIDKLSYIANHIEDTGSIDSHILNAVHSDSEHVIMGLQSLDGEAVSGVSLDPAEYSGIQDTFRGKKAISYVEGKGMLFTCPVFSGKNVKYAVYELFDEYAMKEFLFLKSLDNKKIVITSNEGSMVMPFADVSDEDLKVFAFSEAERVFSDLNTRLGLSGAVADYKKAEGGDYVFFISEIPYTDFRLRGYVLSGVMIRGLFDAISIGIYVFALLLVLYAVGTLYLMIAAKKAGESDELREAKQVAEDANKAKSDFLARMSHEIRTPINAVLGMDEMIIRESDNNHILEYASNINNAGKSLLNLVNDILDFSRIEAGKMEILPVEYNTSFMIADLVNMTEVRAKNKGLTFIINADPTLPSVLYGDEDRVKQCIINILTNAVKYTESGSVTFNMGFERLSDSEVLLKVSVKDTGIGIREEDQEALFSPFERVDEQRNRNIEGTGLGLSIVRNLLSLMGSELKLESEYGKGSVFSFELKQEVRDWGMMGDFAEAYRKSVLSRNKYTELFRAPDADILVVDDTEMNLTVFKGLLKKTMIRVDTALSGSEALKMVRKKEYDMLFIDHRMPVMDGVETLKALNEMEDNLSIGVPCIAFTANAGSGSKEQYRSYGFNDYISKPVSPSELEQLIIKYLPREKIEMIDPDEVTETDTEDEGLNMFIKAFRKSDLLNYSVAIANCGDDALLRDTSITFYNCIDERVLDIRTAVENEDLENYTIKVHALKSSARIIGAVELSKKAEYLERCGADRNIDEIRLLNDDLIDDYLKLKEAMSILYYDYMNTMSDSSEKQDYYKEAVSREHINTFVNNTRAAAENFDFDRVMDSIRLLREYKLTGDLEKLVNDMSHAADLLEEDEIIKIAEEIEKDYGQ